MKSLMNAIFHPLKNISAKILLKVVLRQVRAAKGLDSS